MERELPAHQNSKRCWSGHFTVPDYLHREFYPIYIKKFACYAGIAPFEYASGTSVKGRTRVHPCANKQLKSLLNMAAMNAIKINGEYKQYYKRRQQEGKNNMSTLNIIRNKILARIFAVVKRQTPYVDLYKFAA